MKNIASSSTHHQQTTTPNLTPPGTSPPSEGLGEAALPPFLFPLWAWGGRPSFFKYFHPLPYSLSNIENMSVLFSGKFPFFCSSRQLLLLQSTNLLLFISSLLHALMLPICSLSPCCVFLFPLYYNLFLYLLYNINIYKRINLFIFICFYPLCYLLFSIKIYIIKNVIMCLLFYVYMLKVIYINM